MFRCADVCYGRVVVCCCVVWLFVCAFLRIAFLLFVFGDVNVAFLWSLLLLCVFGVLWFVMPCVCRCLELC